MKADQREWEIGLSSWIIQDGNYNNFETGQHAEFALEFYSQSYLKSGARSKTSKSLGAAKYEIIGEVIYLTPKCGFWILGFVPFRNPNHRKESALAISWLLKSILASIRSFILSGYTSCRRCRRSFIRGKLTLLLNRQHLSLRPVGLLDKRYSFEMRRNSATGASAKPTRGKMMAAVRNMF